MKEIENNYPIDNIKNNYNPGYYMTCEDHPYQVYDYAHKLIITRQIDLQARSKLANMWEVVYSTKSHPIIGTQALDTCYGILLYDRANKEGCCGHAVPPSLIPTLAEMLMWTENRTGKIEYLLVPGYRNVERHDDSGFELLKNYMFEHVPKGIEFIPLVSTEDVRLDVQTLSYEFAFDTEHGCFCNEDFFYKIQEHDPRYIGPKIR